MKCEIMNLKEIKNIGFIGLGVMGSPMCKNLVKNKQWRIIVYDLDNSKEKELEKNGASIAKNLSELFNLADMVITCLPGGDFVKDIYLGKEKIVYEIKPNKFIIDMSTSQPDLMIELNKLITKKGSFFADAPIARTRQAARDGTLAIMVGSKREVYEKIFPILEFMGNNIMHCGDVGTGQITKILNNMILFQTVVALSEAANIAEKYNMSVEDLFENITKCSGDSFALRNHGLKSIAQNHFPSPAFSSEYALKDLSYAINLGKTHNLNLPGANTAKMLLEKSIKNGDKDLYFPVIKKHFG
jgi:3-hydroxyisobutyrate dehydrogenase-like beta-hydroxyacid dehydrogenase